MPYTLIVPKCHRCGRSQEYLYTGPGRSKLDAEIRRDGWRRRLNGKRLDWECGEHRETAASLPETA